VVPSPKSHCQEVGSPEEVSANWTICPAFGEEGLNTKVAVAGAGIIVIVLSALLEPALFVTSRVTLRNPAFVNTWTGFCSMLVDPSPKSHCPDMGLPVEVSMNCTVCPSVGSRGLYVKDTLRVFARLAARRLKSDPDSVCPMTSVCSI
jgi:hypothetical protein